MHVCMVKSVCMFCKYICMTVYTSAYVCMCVCICVYLDVFSTLKIMHFSFLEFSK